MTNPSPSPFSPFDGLTSLPPDPTLEEIGTALCFLGLDPSQDSTDLRALPADVLILASRPASLDALFLRLDAVIAGEMAPSRHAEEVAALFQEIDSWTARIGGLALLGLPTQEEFAMRAPLLARLMEGREMLASQGERAEREVAASPLGCGSVWAYLEGLSLPPDPPQMDIPIPPGILVTREELVDLLTGDLPFQRAREVSAILEVDEDLRAQYEALGAELEQAAEVKPALLADALARLSPL